MTVEQPNYQFPLTVESWGTTSPDVVKSRHISRIEKAVISHSLREQKTTGSSCLPNVAIYAAGHRKPTNSIYPAR